MTGFLISNRMWIIGAISFLFIIAVMDYIRSIIAHKRRLQTEFQKKHYGNDELVYAGETGRKLTTPVPLTLFLDPSSGQPEICLDGRPDLIMREKESGDLYVVDLKSGHAPSAMSSSHELQLAAYFFIVEKNFGEKPVQGIIRYLDEGNKEHVVSNNTELREKLWARVREIAKVKSMLALGEIPEPQRNHNDSYKCAVCKFKELCTQSVAASNQ